MCDSTDYAELVKRAQLGDRDSLDRLAEAARVRLNEYVFRLTLNEDLTGDMVQETILEMLRLFPRLRRADRFWPWLHSIAFNKVRNHYGKNWRRRTRAFSETGHEPTQPSDRDTLAEVVTEELKEIVVRSMAQLAPAHRAVLTMRCYDHLSYAEIAKLAGCSEIGARAMFCRAKRSLARRLASYGLGKSSLAVALVVFGKVTATSEASAAQVAVTAATLQAGPLAALLAATAGKTGVIALATAGSLAVGTAAVNSGKIASVFSARPDRSGDLPVTIWQSESAQQQECWYYFPEGGNNPVMVRLLESSHKKESPTCRVLQNQYANYHLDMRTNTVHVSNYRAWKPDLSVMRLPTDGPDLGEFITQIEGHAADIEPTSSGRRGLLVICRQQRDGENSMWRIDRHLSVLNEESFQFSWPESTPVIDDRDATHKRGWAYFRVTGELGGRSVSGTGCLPFVYAAARAHYPWLRLSVGGRPAFVDTPAGARIYDTTGNVAAKLSGGSLFAGLPRPWMGLHAIDTIRRDAAEQRLPFETAYDSDTGCATVTVHADDLVLAYVVNMEMDVVETIAFSAEAAAGPTHLGELHFTYLQEADAAEEAFAAPADVRPGAAPQREAGMLWLKRLIEDQ